MKTTPIRESANSTMHLKMTFKATLYAWVSIAVMFIAIIPAKLISGIFSQDTTIFIMSLTGFIALLEFVVWCFLSGPQKIYESFKLSKANGSFPGNPLIDIEDGSSMQTTDAGIQELMGDGEKAEGNTQVRQDIPMAKEELKQDTNRLALYKKGCDDYYQNMAAQKKERLDIIAAYLHYIMAPFIKQDEMDSFCNEIMSFAVNPDHVPKPWKGLKGTLTSFDVRHLTWNIAARLGLGKGKPYSVETCVNFIRFMFPDLCEGLDPSTLKNLRVASTSDKIHIDEPGCDGVTFHIPM